MDKRIEILMNNLPDDMDAALLSGYDILRYYTRQSVPDSFLMVTRSSAWFFASPSCRDKAGNIEDVVYVEGNRILPRLAEILEKEKDNIKTIAVQADQMTVAELEQLQKTVPCRVMADGRLDEILYQQSCRKTAEEIQAVQDAQDAADKMFTEVLNYVHAGMDDMELQKIVGVLLRDFGSQRASFDHVTGVGVNTSMPHVRPDGTVIQPGDFVMLDVGATIDGYGSDMTRMFAVEYADDRKRDVMPLNWENHAVKLTRLPGISSRGQDTASIICMVWGIPLGYRFPAARGLIRLTGRLYSADL